MIELLTTVEDSLEELVIEYCHPMLTTITFTAMSGLSNLTVRLFPSLNSTSAVRTHETPHGTAE